MCASGYKALEAYPATSTYKCAKNCLPLSSEASTGGQVVCTYCPTQADSNVYDFSTKTCISKTASCPTNTVKTTLEKMIKLDSSLKSYYAGDTSLVSVCAK